MNLPDQPLENQIQSLKLELQEKQARISWLEGEIERLRISTLETSSEAVQRAVERLMDTAAGPAIQLLTQADLLEKRGKPIQAGDILLVARRIIQTLEVNGLEWVNEPGQVVPFDPNQHASIRTGSQYQIGEMVTVRFAGAQYRGKILRKASVEKVEE